MRIFVTGTGRCGTCTFYQACNYVLNYTCGHESQAGSIASHEYADQHIEVSSHLVLELPLLKIRYPESIIIHLIREKEACVESLLYNCWDAVKCYAEQWHQAKHPYDIVKSASKMYDQVNSLCQSHSDYTFKLEEAEVCWGEFWKLIKAEGDEIAGRGEFNLKYNSRNNRGLYSYEGEINV